jgi:exosortase E/protease (VPEID-CTERM system)
MIPNVPAPSLVAGKDRLGYVCGFWGVLLGLLVSEGLALTLLFDGETLNDSPQWTTVLIQSSSRLVSLSISIGAFAAIVLAGTARWNREFRDVMRTLQRPREACPWVIGHLAAYGCFAWATQRIFEGSALVADPVRWVVFWFAGLLATLTFWARAVGSLNFWRQALQSSWRGLLFGTVAGIAALVLVRWTSAFWEILQRSTFWAAEGLLRLFDLYVVCRPAEFVLGTQAFQVEIAPQCSGYEGIGLSWVFLGAYLLLYRRELRFPAALLLLPVGSLVIWAANVVRIAALIGVGTCGFPELARGGFHSQFGWLAFNAVGLGLVAISRRARLFYRGEPRVGPEPLSTNNPTAAYLGPLLAIGVTTMITGAFSQGQVDWFYPARVLTVLAVLWYFRRVYTTLEWYWSWPAFAIGVFVFVMWMALEPVTPGNARATTIPDGLARMPAFWAMVWLGMRVVGSVVTVPLAEELAFRGYLTRRLISADFLAVPMGRFTWPSFLISSVLFGALHARWLAGVVAGMFYALALYRRGKLADAVLAHVVTNLLIALSVLVLGAWSLWT